MISYVWYVKSHDWKRYFLVLLCFSLGLMSKPMVVTLPFVLLLMDYWPLRRTGIEIRDGNQDELFSVKVKKQTIRFLIIEKIPLFILSAISACVTLYAQKAVSAMMALEYFPFPYRIGNAIISYISYIQKMFWPLNLAVFYPFNYTMSLWNVFLGALLIVAITIAVCIYFRRFPYLPVGWFWYLGTMIPVIGLVQVGSQAMADRYAYVPFIGLFIMLTWGLANAAKNNTKVRIISLLSVLILLILITLSHFQLKHWKDTDNIFNHTLNVTRNNAVAHSALADLLLQKNKTNEALIHIQKSLALDPKSYNTLMRQAWAYSNKNEPQKAIEALRKAIEINPQEPRAYDYIYDIYMRMGKKKEALNEYRNALKLNSNNPEFYTKFGNALNDMGYYDEAIIKYNEALHIQPNHIRANYSLGIVLMQKRDTEGALKQFQKVIEIQPRYAAAYLSAAVILKKKGLIEESSRHYQKAMRIIQSHEATE